MLRWQFKPNSYTTQVDVKVYFLDDSSKEYTFQKNESGNWEPTTEVVDINFEPNTEGFILSNSELTNTDESKLVKDFDVTSSNGEQSTSKTTLCTTQDDLKLCYVVFDKNLFNDEFYTKLGFSESLWNRTDLDVDLKYIPVGSVTSLQLPTVTTVSAFNAWCMYNDDKIENGVAGVIDNYDEVQPYIIPTASKLVNEKSVPVLTWMTDGDGTRTLSTSELQNVINSATNNIAHIIPAGDGVKHCGPSKQ